MLQSVNLSQDDEDTTEKLRALALQLFDSYLGSNVSIIYFDFIPFD